MTTNFSRNEYMKIYTKTLRDKVITLLGGKCCKCGFTDIRALQIDHVNGDGKKETSSLNNGTYYLRILKDTSGKYQLLCANCNWIKRAERNEGSQSKDTLNEFLYG